MTNKTKIMAVADIHGDSGLVKKLAEKAKKEKVDLVIIAGDLTFLGQKTRNIIKPFLDNKQKVLIIPGNHEDDEDINNFSDFYINVRNIHGYGLKHKDVGIFGVGGADIGPNLIEEEEIKRMLKRSHDYIKDMKKKILVTHMHPLGTVSEFSGIEGSRNIRKSIEAFQPDIAVFGHIHEAGGMEDKIGKTRVINVSRRETIFEI